MATPPNSLKTNSSKSNPSEVGASTTSVKKEIDMKMSETDSTTAPVSADKSSPAKRKSATTAHKEPVEQQNGASSSIPSELIAQRAFEIWHEEGCPADRRDANWLQAEKELRAKMTAQ